MTIDDSDLHILVPALKNALDCWRAWRKGKSYLSWYPANDEIVEPLARAIESLDAYRAVAGHCVFSASSGVVIASQSLAQELLSHADRPEIGDAISAAADWLIRTLQTRNADGVFITVIWGLTVSGDVELVEGMTLLSFDRLPDSDIKRRIANRGEGHALFGVWSSRTAHALPGAAIVRKVKKFPYLGAIEKSLRRLVTLEIEAGPLLVDRT